MALNTKASFSPIEIYIEAEQVYSAHRLIKNERFKHVKKVTPDVIYGPSHPVRSLNTPAALLEGYSLELFLKSLWLEENRSLPPGGRDGHNLRKLFEGLPASARHAIKTNYDNAPEFHVEFRQVLAEEGVPSSFEERLECSQLVFVDFRYRYEGPQKGANNLLEEIIYSVREYIEQRYPQWVEAYCGVRPS